MNLLERLKNKIFKCTLSSTIEYHARGFFIKKQVAYLIFLQKNAYYLEREEGLHPKDNDYQILIKEINNKTKYFVYETNDLENNILNLANTKVNIKVMPSIFIENLNDYDLTEILLDIPKNSPLIYNLVFTLKT